jgi:hypothetical protein
VVELFEGTPTTTPHHHSPSSSFWTPLERIILYFRLRKNSKNSKISPFFLVAKTTQFYFIFKIFKIFNSIEKKRKEKEKEKEKALLHIWLLEVKPNPIKMSYIPSP